MAIVVLRCVFVAIAAGLAVTLINSALLPQSPTSAPIIAICVIVGLALAVIAADVGLKRKQLDTISAVYFGLIVGLFLTYLLRLAIVPLLPSEKNPTVNLWVDYCQVGMGMVLCYICISLLIQTKNDFRFIIPYVEFAKEIKGRKPYVLDTSAVIDGRIADVLATGLIENQLIMPRFVIGELQAIADSSDRLKRTRGRRGLDVLNKLKETPQIELTIFDRELPEFNGQTVDQKLVLLAKHLGGRIVTSDFNLNKVAQLHQVGVLNLNELANALKPVFIPGETIEVRIVKPGEEAGQGVGYLDDGTMIVVEAAREQINRQVRVAVTSVLQTNAGRMVFGRYEAGKI